MTIGIEAISYVGTTLLSMIFGSHPGCRSVGHCYLFFKGYGKSKQHLIDKENVCEICSLLEKKCDLNALKLARDIRPSDAYEYIQNVVLFESGETIIDSSSVTPWFKESKPHHIVWMFRDPVTLASSYKKKGLSLDYMINAYNSKYKKAVTPVIEYRKIIEETDELKALFTRLGLEFSPEYLEYWKYDNHMTGGNPGVLLNYAKHHNLDTEEIIERISSGSREYKRYYEKSEGNFTGAIDILTPEERVYVVDKCFQTYRRLLDLQNELL